MMPHKIVLIVNDTIGENMAGSGIRFWEFARSLSQHAAVTLTVPPIVPLSSLPQPDFAADIVICRSKAELQATAQSGDVIVTMGRILAQYPFLARMDIPLVLDLYDPFLLAGLYKFSDRSLLDRITLNDRYRKTHHFQLNAADFIICASENQRDYWLGMLALLGRINPLTHEDDPTFRRLIDVVPFGLPAQSPEHTHPVIKGVYKTIAPHDKVILWGGGIWNWFDAPTMIRAMARIAQYRTDVKLFFMGIKRPNTAIPKMPAVDEAIVLSKELGLYNQTVFFNDWVPYNERQDYLLEADIGVSLHLDHAETRFAFRTRFLDYLWAGLPMVVTEGDTLSELVQMWNLGHVIKVGDVEGVIAAIMSILEISDLKASYQTRFSSVADYYRWDKVIQPLLDFCLNPYQAPDKIYVQKASMISRYTMSWQDNYEKVMRVVHQEGIKSLPKEVVKYLKWKFNRH